MYGAPASGDAQQHHDGGPSSHSEEVLSGSATAFAHSKVAAIRDPGVISIDVDIQSAPRAVARVDPSCELLTLLEANVLDKYLPSLVERHLPADAVCLVIEDTAHTGETTAAALRGFSRFVRPGGFFVVEDGWSNGKMRVDSEWPREVIPVILDFLSSSLRGRLRSA